MRFPFKRKKKEEDEENELFDEEKWADELEGVKWADRMPQISLKRVIALLLLGIYSLTTIYTLADVPELAIILIPTILILIDYIKITGK